MGKDIIKAMLVGGLIFIMFLLMCGAAKFIFEKGDILLLYLLVIIGLGLMYLIPKINNKLDESKTDLYYRNIEKKYAPAIISYIFNMNIEKRATILSSILDLHVKKYLNIKKVNNRYFIDVIKKDTKKLFFHERYIMACLSNNKLIELDEFSELVELDCKKELLTKDNENNAILVIILIIVIVSGINFLLLAIKNRGDLAVASTLLPGCIIYILAKINKPHIRTLKGERLATEAKGLKNFLKDYTLINEKDIDYTKIADRYLGFAIAINEAKNMEKLYIDNSEFLSRYIKMEGVENYERTN